jgi:AcrR family transcriptional regulator
MPSNAKNLLLVAARKEIEEYGVLGFRISRVAKKASCSITQIYRYFDSRNGLVARALSDLYQEILDMGFDAAEQYVQGFTTMTVDDVLAIFTGPKELAQMPMMPVRLQILAVASTIPELEEQLSEITQRQFGKWLQLIEDVRGRLPQGVTLDERVVTIDLVLMMPYYARLMGDHAVTANDYVEWVRHKLFPGQ